jgi:HAD superfamily hydrolase (TIGR01509 family)
MTKENHDPQTMTRSLTTLIFDVDGTLADTEREGHRVAFNLAFQDAGLDWYWSEDLYGALLSVAGGKERIRFFIKRYRPNFGNLRPDSTDLQSLIKKLHQAKTAHYSARVSSGKIQPRPGVLRLIHDARDAGLRLAIATTSAPENAIALLQSMIHPDSPQWFEVIAAGDIVPNKKPAPDIYQYVLNKMAVDPKECLVFEDSEHGLSAAVQTGLPTIVTVNGYTRTQDFSGAVVVVNHLGDPGHTTEAIASLVDISGWLTNSADSYIDLPCLRAIHQQALSLCL